MMFNLSHRLISMADRAAALDLFKFLEPLTNRYKSVTLSTAGFVIKAGGGVLVKTGAAVTHYIANGVKGRIAAATDMPALTGYVVANATFNVFVFTVSSAGTTYVQMGTAGATEAAMKFPLLDQKRAILGMIIVNPAGTGDFTGNSTALDDVTVFSSGGVTYVSPVGMFDPGTIV